MELITKKEKAKLTQLPKMVNCVVCGRGEQIVKEYGNGKEGILIVFESPTESQSRSNDWSVCNSTVLSILRQWNFDIERDCFLTGVFLCAGSGTHYKHCLFNLMETISKKKPKLIITVGGLATGAVLSIYNNRHFKINGSSDKFVGRLIPLQKKRVGAFEDELFGCWLAPVMSEKDIHSYDNPKVQAVAKLWMSRHLDYALCRCNIPVEPLKCPDEREIRSRYCLETSEDKVVEWLHKASEAKYAAFDYETNCLQPELEKARVLTVSVAYGDSDGIQGCFAFSMDKFANVKGTKVVDEWKNFLRSKSKKIVANVKFEERWSRVFYNQPIQNFYWDVAIGSRVMECYSGRAGLKFSTFVYFGVVGYDDIVDEYIEDDESHYNSLDEKVDRSDLLLYNYYDSYYTYYLAKAQHTDFGIEF